MVRAAFEGGGRNFHSTAAFRVFVAWLKTRDTARMEIAIDRPRKLRFPNGSEILISGCPNYAAAASRLSNPQVTVETERPEPRRWRLVFGYPPS